MDDLLECVSRSWNLGCLLLMGLVIGGAKTEMENELPTLVFQPYVQHRVYGAWVGNQSDKGMDMLYKAVNVIVDNLQPNEFPHSKLNLVQSELKVRMQPYSSIILSQRGGHYLVSLVSFM